MSNIEKELKTKKDQAFSEIESRKAVEEVKLLMDASAAEDQRLFRALGRHHSIAVAEDILGKKTELERLDGMYAGNVFTKDQIKKLAIKYNLRFLLTKHYAGKMDVEVAAKIWAFEKETGTPVTNDASLQYKFYILAPEECFKLEKVRLAKIWDAKDPAIFFEVDHEHYRLIHKWGTDFTITNRIAGLRHESRTQRFFIDLIISFLSCFCLFYLVRNQLSFSLSYWWMLLPIVAYVLGNNVWVWDRDGRKVLSKNKWDKVEVYV